MKKFTNSRACVNLRENENIPSDSGVNEQTTATRETLSLLDDPITAPTLPECVVPYYEGSTDDSDSVVEKLDVEAKADSSTASTSSDKVTQGKHDSKIILA